MKKILNCLCTKHFLEKINERKIEKYLISLCLAKGKETKTNNQKKYTITKKEIKEAAVEGYIELYNYIGIETLTVVVEKNRLITAFSRYSDVGLALN